MENKEDSGLRQNEKKSLQADRISPRNQHDRFGELIGKPAAADLLT
jgi:hypothetical protein